MVLQRRVPQSLVAVLIAAATWVGAAQHPLHVMIANDDGVNAPGIEALARTVAGDPGYRVTVVAPAKNQSAIGHALVIRRAIKVAPHKLVGGAPAWSVDATPATTVRVGIAELLKNDRPDLMLSGINRGENVGLIAWYSGTLGAAREASLLGIPAVAFSLQLDWGDPHPDYAGAARWAKRVVDAVSAHGLPQGIFLNVNIPRDMKAIRGFRPTRMGLAADPKSHFEVVRREGETRWLRSVWVPPANQPVETDAGALMRGWVTIVPLGLDQTSFRAFPALEWLMGIPAPAPQTKAH